MLVLLVCSFYVLCVRCEVTLEADCPSVKVEVSHRAVLECCFKSSGNENFLWIKSSRLQLHTEADLLHNAVTDRRDMGQGRHCGVLIISAATLNASGLYRCFLNASKVFTHGTYLRVYKPLEKTIQLRESVKNGILTAEGVLLLLCVLVPSVPLLFKSKRLNDLEKKKVKQEENTYQALDLYDCSAAYDQIVHQREGPYEDVGINEDIQLEQP